MPSGQTPGWDCDASLVNAKTGILAPRAIGATDAVSVDVNGPSIRLSPLDTAAWAAVAEPTGVPPVSKTSNDGPLLSCSASWAAWSRAWPRSARGPVKGSKIAAACRVPPEVDVFGPNEVGEYDPDWYPPPYRPAVGSP